MSQTAVAAAPVAPKGSRRWTDSSPCGFSWSWRLETRALTEALRGLDLTPGLILTEANSAPLEADGLTREVVSLAEWLLQD